MPGSRFAQISRLLCVSQIGVGIAGQLGIFGDGICGRVSNSTYNFQHKK